MALCNMEFTLSLSFIQYEFQEFEFLSSVVTLPGLVFGKLKQVDVLHSEVRHFPLSAACVCVK